MSLMSERTEEKLTTDISMISRILNTVDNFTVPEILDTITDNDTYIVSLILNSILGFVVISFGLVANVINLAVFTKQGFADSINVSFASLATADLLALIFALWRAVLFLPQMQDSSLPIDPKSVLYLTGGWPHVYFVRVGSWITAFITFERCLCIAMPLKVKSIITPKRVVFVHCTIYLLIASTVVPIYVISTFTWKFYPDRNRTLIGLAHASYKYDVERVVLPINGNAIPLGALLVTIVCTAILIAKLLYHKRWRDSQASGGIPDKTSAASDRESRVIKMAVAISTIYIVIFVPVSVVLTWMTEDSEYRLDGKLQNSFIVGSSFMVFFQTFNSSVNIFVYYNMSSKFKSTMREMLRLKS